MAKRRLRGRRRPGRPTRRAGRPAFAGYHEFGEGRLEVEAGFPASGPVEGDGDVRPSGLPGGQVAITLHAGPYDQMEPAYQALASWVSEHGGNSRATPGWSTSATRPHNLTRQPGAPRVRAGLPPGLSQGQPAWNRARPTIRHAQNWTIAVRTAFRQHTRTPSPNRQSAHALGRYQPGPAFSATALARITDRWKGSVGWF
jgi:GyrI-like small molecule binding domain